MPEKSLCEWNLHKQPGKFSLWVSYWLPATNRRKNLSGLVQNLLNPVLINVCLNQAYAHFINVSQNGGILYIHCMMGYSDCGVYTVPYRYEAWKLLPGVPTGPLLQSPSHADLQVHVLLYGRWRRQGLGTPMWTVSQERRGSVLTTVYRHLE